TSASMRMVSVIVVLLSMDVAAMVPPATVNRAAVERGADADLVAVGGWLIRREDAGSDVVVEPG
ncbi:MAG TPA: hypothetical protein VF880_14085, partial [Actinomycetes bacterium]